MQQRRRSERRWRKSGLTADRQITLHPPPRVGEDTSCRQRKLCVQQQDQEQLQRSCKDLLHTTGQSWDKKKDSTLPSSIPTVDLPDTFGDFFSAKIQKLRDELTGPTLETFSLVTEQHVTNIIEVRLLLPTCVIFS